MFGGRIPLALWLGVAGLLLLAIIAVLSKSPRISRPLSFVAALTVPGGLFVVGGLSAGSFGSQIGSAAVAALGGHILFFREQWIGINQRFSGSIISWHSKYRNSKFLVIAMGIFMIAIGIATLFDKLM